MTTCFDNMIGQKAVKRKLGFYVDAHKVTQRAPFVLFSGNKGCGKTAFAREFADNLRNSDGSKRPFLELNCSVLKNNQTFFENIFLTYLQGNNINCHFDESHNLPKDLAQALLTICNSDSDPVREFRYQDSTFTFNFKKISFLFSTTETDKIFAPLKDRFDIVDFEPYSVSELIDIMKLNCSEVVFINKSEELLGQTLRGNARSAVKMAEQVNTYCDRFGKTFFDEQDFFELCRLVNVLPHGIMNTELTILKELNSRGSCSLQMLASATGLSRTAIQKNFEEYLLKCGFMKIDGQRKITTQGQQIMEKCISFLEKANA
jgi:Holliday junction resolvasome RuvABC ATP-dependent DNA helicase subunit